MSYNHMPHNGDSRLPGAALAQRETVRRVGRAPATQERCREWQSRPAGLCGKACRERREPPSPRSNGPGRHLLPGTSPCGADPAPVPTTAAGYALSGRGRHCFLSPQGLVSAETVPVSSQLPAHTFQAGNDHCFFHSLPACPCLPRPFRCGGARRLAFRSRRPEVGRLNGNGLAGPLRCGVPASGRGSTRGCS